MRPTAIRKSEGGVDGGFGDRAADFDRRLGNGSGGFERVSGNGFATDHGCCRYH